MQSGGLVTLVIVCWSLGSLVVVNAELGSFWRVPELWQKKDRTWCRLFDKCGKPCLKFDIDGMGAKLHERLHGQPLVADVVIKAISAHLRGQPERPLVLSFHGPTGVGKNFVTRIIIESMFLLGFESNRVQYFVASRDFPHSEPMFIHAYKDHILEAITSKAQKCSHSIFVFDEIDKMPVHLIDIVSSFLDFASSDQSQYNTSNSIFMFLSNTGEKKIVEYALNAWVNGKPREQFNLHDFEAALTNSAFNEEGGLWHTDLIKRHLISFFVPFLPLEKCHLRNCLRDYLHRRNYTDLVDDDRFAVAILDQVIYIPGDKRLFSSSGCKRIPQKVEMAVVDRMYKTKSVYETANAIPSEEL